MVTEYMQADLRAIIKSQSLTDQHVQFLVYQIVRALKVCIVMIPIILSLVQMLKCGRL